MFRGGPGAERVSEAPSAGDPGNQRRWIPQAPPELSSPGPSPAAGTGSARQAGSAQRLRSPAGPGWRTSLAAPWFSLNPERLRTCWRETELRLTHPFAPSRLLILIHHPPSSSLPPPVASGFHSSSPCPPTVFFALRLRTQKQSFADPGSRLWQLRSFSPGLPGPVSPALQSRATPSVLLGPPGHP